MELICTRIMELICTRIMELGFVLIVVVLIVVVLIVVVLIVVVLIVDYVIVIEFLAFTLAFTLICLNVDLRRTRNLSLDL